VVLADHDLDIDAEVVGVAKDFEDAAAGLAVEGGPVSDLDVHDQAFQVVRNRVRRLGVMGVFTEDAMWGGFCPWNVILI
jgi:hypothetical protein